MQHTFKVGDRVRVVSKRPADGESGDHVYWVEEMDGICGVEATIRTLEESGGYLAYTIDVPGEPHCWWVRPHWLELIGPEPVGGYVTLDSGERQEFATGALRDPQTGKGRYDLLPPVALRRWAELLERGAIKYGDHNWRRGIPLARFLSSAARHLYQLIEGEGTEDHAAAVLFNIGGYLQTLADIEAGRLPASLDDRPSVAVQAAQEASQLRGNTVRATEDGGP